MMMITDALIKRNIPVPAPQFWECCNIMDVEKEEYKDSVSDCRFYDKKIFQIVTSFPWNNITHIIY